jgi:peptide/nickel transport system ATP-binding protein
MPLLEVDALVVDIETPAGILHAVRDVSFRVERGEMLCIVGETGCGKSMTALALMGLLPRNAVRRARRLLLEGEELSAASLVRLRGNRMSMIFQEPMTALNPCYTIGDQLSEVHRQRVMIAMALMCSPTMLIADEPTTALDVTIQAQILRLLLDLQRDLGIGILLITHDLGVVARAADRVAVMYAGEIVETATTAELFATPRHPYTCGLMASIPVPGKTPPGARLGAIPGTVPALFGEVRGCAFRTRCAHAMPICSNTIVPRSQAAHVWRCVLEETPLEAA